MSNSDKSFSAEIHYWTQCKTRGCQNQPLMASEWGSKSSDFCHDCLYCKIRGCANRRVTTGSQITDVCDHCATRIMYQFGTQK